MDTSQYLYLTPSNRTYLTEEFYKLGLHQKYEVIDELERLGNLEDNEHLLVALATSILQHSSDESKENMPCRGIRRLPLQAKIADLRRKLLEHPDVAVLSEMLA